MAIVIKLFEHDPEKIEVEIPENENVLICQHDSIRNREEPEKSLGAALDFMVEAVTKTGRKILSYSVSITEQKLSDTQIFRWPLHYYVITMIIEPAI